MKKFKFTLQALLNVKNSLEKQKKGELSDQNAVIRKLEDERDDMISRRAAMYEEYTLKVETGIPVNEMLGYTAGFNASRDKIAEQQLRIHRAEKVKERIQRELTELMAERKMLEKLKEKQYAEYLEESRREDAKQIDDFLSNKIAEEV